MAIMEANSDSDVMRVWTLLNELSEQLSQNRNASISLHTVTGGVKVRMRQFIILNYTQSLLQTQAIHSQTGFVLRRCVSKTLQYDPCLMNSSFNQDKPQGSI